MADLEIPWKFSFQYAEYINIAYKSTFYASYFK